MYDAIVIGAGPAGLTSALYLGRANKKVLVLEAKNYGGQIINAYNIENYPGIKKINGYDFATNLYEQVESLGVDIIYEEVIKITKDKEVMTRNHTWKSKTIIIATGTTNRKLNLEGEDRFLGKGISYCATCDGAFFKGKEVAVCGGGNTALEDALYLTNIASKVYLIHRRDTFRGEDRYLEEIKDKHNIEIIVNTNIIGLEGEQSLKGLILKDQSGKTHHLDVQGLFIAIGQDPQSTLFKDILDMDANGYVQSADCLTKVSGIYVAGDVRSKELRQLTTAISDGSICANMAIKEMGDEVDGK